MDLESNESRAKPVGALVVFTDIKYEVEPPLSETLLARILKVIPSSVAKLPFKAASNSYGSTGISDAPQSGRVILDGACGALRPGRLTFILGPSGAGKTTLLQILAGRKRSRVSGWHSGIGRGTVLVAQDAQLLPALSARETLYFAARLKLPRASQDQRKDTVLRVARDLGLTDVLDTLCNRMSGGERKRLTIALELLTDPPVLLLDEPTSGLDVVSSACVLRTLSALASCGRTVCCVLHAPSSRLHALADDVLLMTSRGRVLYAGPRESVVQDFASAGFHCPQFYNPADFMLEVACGEHAGEGDTTLLEAAARAYALALRDDTNKPELHSFTEGHSLLNGTGGRAHRVVRTTSVGPGRYAASFVRQSLVLLWRSVVSGRRDRHLSQWRLAAHVAVAVLLGALFAGSGSDAARLLTNTSCVFFFLLFLFFANAMPTIHTFPIEASVVMQEHLNNWYSIPAYFISKLVADIPLQLLCPSLFLLPAWYLTDQPAEAYRWWLAWGTCVLLTVLAQTFGLLAGAAFQVKMALFIVPAANIPMLMFSGFFIPYSEMPSYLQPFATVSYFKYAFDAIMQAVYGFERATLDCSVAFCHMRSPQEFLESLSLNGPYWKDTLALITWIVILQISLLLVLMYRVKRTCK